MVSIEIQSKMLQSKVDYFTARNLKTNQIILKDILFHNFYQEMQVETRVPELEGARMSCPMWPF